jgi:hypothetical protein
MDINKLDVMLCLALQESDGPFEIKLIKKDSIQYLKMTKDEILKTSDIEEVQEIVICTPRSDRRWRKRNKTDRRQS